MVCLQDGQCFEGHFFANSFELHDCVDFALIERRSRWLWVWFLLPYSVMPKPSKPVLANINQILIHPTFLHASTRYWESQLCCAVFILLERLNLALIVQPTEWQWRTMLWHKCQGTNVWEKEEKAATSVQKYAELLLSQFFALRWSEFHLISLYCVLLIRITSSCMQASLSLAFALLKHSADWPVTGAAQPDKHVLVVKQTRTFDFSTSNWALEATASYNPPHLVSHCGTSSSPWCVKFVKYNFFKSQSLFDATRENICQSTLRVWWAQRFGRNVLLSFGFPCCALCQSQTSSYTWWASIPVSIVYPNLILWCFAHTLCFFHALHSVKLKCERCGQH